jgi:hypothetical protein
MESFNIGDKVMYIGSTQEQINWGNNDDPRKVLVEKQEYEIECMDVYSQHTKLTLKNICGRFNSVSFEKL